MFINSRRDFLRLTCKSVTTLGAIGALSRIGQMNALAAGNPNYKALVCIFLVGGNDGHNTIVPINTTKQNYPVYSAARQVLALPQASLLPINTKTGDVYGLHPGLPEIQNLYNQNKVALLANVGSLVAPVTRPQYLAKSVALPANLFSHSDQQQQWDTGVPNNLATTGWAGKTADLMQGINAPSTYPMVVTVAQCGLFCSGQQTNPSTAPPNVTLGLQGFNGQPAKLSAFQQLLSFDGGLSLVQAGNSVMQRGVNDAATLNGALSSAPAMQTVFPNTSLGNQLKQVAKIVSVRGGLGMTRQIFFATLDGFDTHGGQLPLQDSLLQQLSQAMGAFYNATVELGVDQQVTTFTSSEFGRTLQPSSGGGSDHAWGGHQMVMGGAVQGGDLYGQYPTLAFGGPDDANARGTMIPTTSVEQYGATLASWFGVSAANLPSIFPALPNFTVQNLGILG